MPRWRVSLHDRQPRFRRLLAILSVVFIVSCGYALYRDARRQRYCPTPFECRGGTRCQWASGCEGERIANLPKRLRPRR